MAEHESQAAQFHATSVIPQLEKEKQNEKDTTTPGAKDLSGGGSIPLPVYTTHAAETSTSVTDSSSSSNNTGDLSETAPTEEEINTLRRVSDKLPLSAWFVAVVELCERFAYYGISGPFQNYMQNTRHDLRPGALGMGQKGATGLSYFFQFWCYVTPIIGAIVADQYLGKYNTILAFSCIYIVGLFILFFTSLPTSLEHGAGLGGLIAAMLVIGLGTGGIKSNVSPLIAEQYRGTKQKIKVLKSGERVIVDPGVTIQSIYMIFYMCINVGSLSSIATTELELNVDFWAAYLLPLIIFFIGVAALLMGRKHYIVRPPKGSVVSDAFRAMWMGLRYGRGNMDAAKSTYREDYGILTVVPWSDQFVDELKRALVACKVFTFFPIYWIVYGQMTNNFISQAGTMETHGIPNDIMQNIDPITIVIFIPICDVLVYPLLRKIGIPFKPITRIAAGFLFASLAMAYAAIVQHIIYSSGPCYKYPLDDSMACSNNGSIPNRVHVAVQTPGYLFIGLSEIFASITGLEYAFTKAPPSMKSFVTSMFLLTSAFGSAIGIALSPTAENPKLVWMYTGLSIATALAGVVFWIMFRSLNDTEEEMNALAAAKVDGTKDLDTVVGIRTSVPVNTEGVEVVAIGYDRKREEGRGEKGDGLV